MVNYQLFGSLFFFIFVIFFVRRAVSSSSEHVHFMHTFLQRACQTVFLQGKMQNMKPRQKRFTWRLEEGRHLNINIYVSPFFQELEANFSFCMNNPYNNLQSGLFYQPCIISTIACGFMMYLYIQITNKDKLKQWLEFF